MRRHELIELSMPDGRAVRGTYSFTPNDEPSPAVIFAHGFGSTRGGEKAAALEAECAHREWAFAAFDFRGHGQSDGTMRELLGSRLLEDLDAITHEVARRAGDRLFLFGSSMGGWASAWFTARYPNRVAACAFVAPAFRFLEWHRLSDAEREEWRRLGYHRVHNEYVDVEISYDLIAEAEQFKFDTLAINYNTPTIIFHGMADEIVPYPISLEFTSTCATKDVELVLIKDGDHRLNRDKEQLAREACNFFNAQVLLVSNNVTNNR